MRFPGSQDRTTIIGSTGTGKTVAALYHLSNQNFHQMPWVIYDWKGDDNLSAIPGAAYIGVHDMPTLPGIYIVQPEADTDDAAVQEQMKEIWRRGFTGVYIDEGYMVGRKNTAYRRLLTQGRAKHIPMIVLSQRPVWLDVFQFSESGFFQIFRLNFAGDRKTVSEWVPHDPRVLLPEYHSLYFDVAKNELTKLGPVWPAEKIHQRIGQRMSAMLRERRKVIA